MLLVKNLIKIVRMKLTENETAFEAAKREYMEETTNTPVTMIGTGERNCDIIDLRQYF